MRAYENGINNINLQLIDRHQSTPPSRTNQELRLPAYGVSQKNNVIGQAYFFLPLPLPPLLFLPSHLPSGLILLLSPIFLCHRIKDGGFIVAIRLTSFRPPKIRLHCRLSEWRIRRPFPIPRPPLGSLRSPIFFPFDPFFAFFSHCGARSQARFFCSCYSNKRTNKHNKGN